MTLSTKSTNGVDVNVGDTVITAYGKAIVRIVEGPIPGSRATKDGVATLFVRRYATANAPNDSEHYVVRCDRVEVVA